MEEKYELDLEIRGEQDMWYLYRQASNEPYAHLIIETTSIEEVFLAMFKDKASRGKGSTVIIG
jgi:hypothetical protein